MAASIDCLIIGAGPAGLRAAEVLAAGGREVLVLEKNDDIGPKTCAGGLTPKAMREVEALGLPADEGLVCAGYASFTGGKPFVIDEERCRVRTVSRRALGQHQAARARAAGAEIRTGTPAAHIDLANRTVEAHGQRLVYRRLIGADGSESRVSRALRLPAPRACFACEYNVPGVRLEPLLVECDPVALANGYFWIFPHTDYTSIGAGAPKHIVPPSVMRHYLDGRLAALGIGLDAAPFEGVTIEVQHVGTDFADDVYLVGDAAGLPSALTLEGIHAALVSGEEVARGILSPGMPRPKLSRWLRTKRWHDRLASRLGSLRVRQALLPAFTLFGKLPITRRVIAEFYLGG